MPQIRKNRQALEKSTEYTTILAEYMGVGRGSKNYDEGPLEQIIDIRLAINFFLFKFLGNTICLMTCGFVLMNALMWVYGTQLLVEILPLNGLPSKEIQTWSIH